MTFVIENLATQYDNSSVDITSITLDVGRTLREKKTLNSVSHSTVGGLYTSYTYSNHRDFDVPIRYLTSSDALVINDWWYRSYDLTFSTDVSTLSVIITNMSEPFRSLERPYKDLYSGTLMLSGL